MIDYIAITTILIWVVFLLVMILTNASNGNYHSKKQPFVSLIIAVRNEERHIEAFCSSLSALSYPKEKFEILIGNDASSDQTRQLLEKHMPDNTVLHNYTENETGQFGKQKVISDLAAKSKGEYLFFTDGDMSLPQDWIQGLLAGNEAGHNLVVGLTGVRKKSLFSKMQHIDWLFNQQIVSWFANHGIGLTAWGNNMMISKLLYDKVGGYSALGNSMVEDVDLLRAVQSAGGKLVVRQDTKTVAFTSPEKSLLSLLHQRKRWMSGVSKYRILLFVGAWMKLLFWPAVLYLSLSNIYWLSSLPIVMILKRILHRRWSKLTFIPISLPHLLLFEVYEFVFYLLTFAFRLLPVHTRWKGRKY